MLQAVLIILIVLWLLGVITIPGLGFLNIVLFQINAHPITLLNIIVFLFIASLIELLPSPLNIVAGVLLLLWVLSILGILVFANLSNIIVLVVIVAIIVSLLGII